MSTLKRIALLTVVGSLVLAAGAQAKSLSPVAVQRAVAFWQPYSSTPVCGDGLTIHQTGYGETPGPSFIRREDGRLVPQCELFADPSIAQLPVADQCAWVARNIGASFFGLGASNDARNVMYQRRWVTPAACRR